MESFSNLLKNAEFHRAKMLDNKRNVCYYHSCVVDRRDDAG